MTCPKCCRPVHECVCSPLAAVRALRKRVEELESRLQGRHNPGCDEALREAQERAEKAEAEAERFRHTSDKQAVAWKERAEKAEANLCHTVALLEAVEAALKAAHPDTDVSDFMLSFPVVRLAADTKMEAQAEGMARSEAEAENAKIKADLDAALVVCETLGVQYGRMWLSAPAFKAGERVQALLAEREARNGK